MMERIDGGAGRAADHGVVLPGLPPKTEADNTTDFDDLRERISERAERIADAIDRRTRVISVVRKNPLAAIGVAFSVGVAIAAATAVGDRHWAIERGRRQLRAMIIGGLAATFADELRDLLAGEGLGSIVHSFMADEDDSDI